MGQNGHLSIDTRSPGMLCCRTKKAYLEVGPVSIREPRVKVDDALVCVRFHYDAVLRQRLKTVELIVDRAEWTPPLALGM